METKSSSGSASKTHTVSEPDFDRLELAQTTGDGTPPGDFVVVADSPAEGVKLAKDGKTILVPQPSDSPEDPLNWSWTKKHLILFTITFGANVSDFSSSAGYPPTLAQSMEWGVSYSTANLNNSLNILAGGLGGLVWVPLASGWARAPVFFWSTLIGFAFALGTCFTRDQDTMIALRFMMGLFLTSAQTVSIGVLKDIFFFHESARKIGLWAVLYISSPYLGPCFGNFILGATNHWPDVMWLTSGTAALQLVFIVLFLDESWYNRQWPAAAQPPRPNTFWARMSRVMGIWSIKRHNLYFPTVKASFIRFGWLATRPAFLLIWFSYFLVFGWAIGINVSASFLFAAPREAGGYGYSYTSLGYLYFTPIVGILIGELVGHYGNDWIQKWYIRRHNGKFEPEARLYMLYASAPFYLAGLLLTGFALEDHLSVVAVIFGWGMYSFGIMLSSVAVTSYVTDAYPAIPADVAGWINFGRVIGGFAIGFYQEPWGAAVGYKLSFGTQAIICAVAIIPVIALSIYGRRLRLSYPMPKFDF